MKGTIRRILTAALVCAVIATSALVSAQPIDAATYTSGSWTSTVYFNKLETRDIATSEAAAAAACGALATLNGRAGAVCGLYAAHMVHQANRAQNRDMCLKAKIVNYPHPVIWFDIYGNSKYCR